MFLISQMYLWKNKRPEISTYKYQGLEMNFRLWSSIWFVNIRGKYFVTIKVYVSWIFFVCLFTFLKDPSKSWNAIISLVGMEFIYSESQGYYIKFCLSWLMVNLGCPREVYLNSTLPISTSVILSSSMRLFPKCFQS